jgi:hypothetical protein
MYDKEGTVLVGLMTTVSELRHLDDTKDNFMLSESEYPAPLILYLEKEEIQSKIIYSFR